MFKFKKVKKLEQKLDSMDRYLNKLIMMSEDELKTYEKHLGKESDTYQWNHGYLSALKHVKEAFENWE